MYNTIVHKLHEVEQNYHVKLLYVAESGSRAWGFSSTDSDYDVRGIFIHPETAYLSIDPPQKTFEWIENKWFDVGAWDIRMALKLLRKSNCVLFEWLQSPIVYQQYPAIQSELFALAEQYYQPKAILHHYRGIAKTASASMSGNEIRLKKWFYLLRALLAANWMVKCNSIPPMQLVQLLVILPETEQYEILELVQFKADKNEHFLWTPTLSMQQLIDRLWQETNIKLGNRKTSGNELLNQWFRKKLDEIDN